MSKNDSKIQIEPELCLMGAGPGDPELLTIKAYRLLKRAAVVLYDNLANADILNLTSPGCEHIYVGKKAYGSYTPQEEIHKMISLHIHKGLVIRLKGGDPFIFGRGFEEIMYAGENGIKTSYIPGISSMQAFGFENIPLTHRGLSESIWIVTGTKKDQDLSDDLHLAIRSKATVVIYMGLRKLAQIASIYSEAGKGDTPAALLQHATLKHAKCIRSSISNLPELAQAEEISYPAIILIGEVAALARHF